MGVDEGNIQVMDVEMIMENCPITFLFVADSHIQRIVLATDETRVTQQVSHRPIKC